jgi:hypothetical protein
MSVGSAYGSAATVGVKLSIASATDFETTLVEVRPRPGRSAVPAGRFMLCVQYHYVALPSLDQGEHVLAPS